MYKLFILVVFASFVSCQANSQQVKSAANKAETVSDSKQGKEKKSDEVFFINSEGKRIDKVVKKEEEWSQELDKMEFYVIREKGTERSFTSDLLKNKKSGVYTCKACSFPLFKSETKYKSGTGWPSFYQPIDNEHILEDTDYDLGYARTEVMCRRCEGHLGHVFKDGPKPTGLRYCINGVSLDFEEGEK